MDADSLSDATAFLLALGKAPSGFDWTKIPPEDRGQWAKWALEWEARRTER